MAAHNPTLAFQTLPPRTLSRLTLVGHRKSELQDWISHLPIMNAAESGKQLHQTLRELTSLAVDADQRFALLEVLEPAIHTLVNMLAKHVHTASASSMQARRVSAFTQNLHLQLALNYKIVALESLRKLDGRVGLFDLGRTAARLQAATAMQRAIHHLGQSLLEAALTYGTPPASIWTDLHGLFQIAVAQHMADQPIPDRHAHRQEQSTVRLGYLRAVFMTVSQLHKLRPTEIRLLGVHSETWAGLLAISEQLSGSLLVCNPGENPPAYPHRLPPTPASWYIRSQALITHLQTLNQTTTEVPAGLIAHLLEVWRNSRERMFDRRSCDQSLLLCLGLSASHYFMSGEQDFNQIIAAVPRAREIAAPSFLFALEEDTVSPEAPDTWQVCSASPTAPLEDDRVQVAPMRSFAIHPVQAVNRSPAGYGIRWTESSPSELRPGELVGICEARGRGWVLGLMHWVRQSAAAGVEAGLEVLSTQAKACAICLSEQGRDKSQYLRGMLIPALPALERPATLIAPTSFATGQDVRICLHGQTIEARLTRLVLATPSLCQFEFALLTAASQVTALPSPGDDIDDLWAQL